MHSEAAQIEEGGKEGGREAKSPSAANGISNGRGLLLLRSIEEAIFMPDSR